MIQKDLVNTCCRQTSQYDSGNMADLRHAMQSLP
jgi:hypothetical protein